MKDMFPPEAPIGLVAVPGFASAANNSTQKPTIDLSWEPDMEPRVAGYKVYRHDLDGNATNEWHQLNSELLPGAAYRDLAVVARRRYDYRVTAVSDLGNESAPSEEVVETAPEQ
jgi:fibronectin type 3 domain-containing protein